MEQNETTTSYRLRDFDTRNGQVLVTESISAQSGSSLNAHHLADVSFCLAGAATSLPALLAALKREHDANVGVPFAHGECGPVRARDIRHCPLEPSSTRAAASCELKSVDVQPGPGDG